MSFGNTTKTTTTPTEAANVTDFRNSLYPQISSLIANAGKPVYGAAQQAQFTNNLNQNTNANMNSLASSIAGRTGSLNGGAFSSGAQNLLAQRGAAQANYNMQTPMLNQQAMLQNQGAALGIGANLAGRAPVGSVTDSTTTEGLGNVLMSAAGAAAGLAMPGFSSLMGGGSFLGGMMGQGPSPTLMSGIANPWIGNGGAPQPDPSNPYYTG